MGVPLSSSPGVFRSTLRNSREAPSSPVRGFFFCLRASCHRRTNRRPIEMLGTSMPVPNIWRSVRLSPRQSGILRRRRDFSSQPLHHPQHIGIAIDMPIGQALTDISSPNDDRVSCTICRAEFGCRWCVNDRLVIDRELLPQHFGVDAIFLSVQSDPFKHADSPFEI
jgi:hypothetical protein